ncbi:Uncharacterised protein [Serratia quinivorans]|nr:Uncharacterised protein [Serratia quinivorans]CAI1986861.1 Uncharacterised protein [Serratia quinivorans]
MGQQLVVAIEIRRLRHLRLLPFQQLLYLFARQCVPGREAIQGHQAFNADVREIFTNQLSDFHLTQPVSFFRQNGVQLWCNVCLQRQLGRRCHPLPQRAVRQCDLVLCQCVMHAAEGGVIRSDAAVADGGQCFHQLRWRLLARCH